MERSTSAVLLMEETVLPGMGKPLMLEAFLAAPVLAWMGRRLLTDGVQRIFLACEACYEREGRACLPPELTVTVSDRREDLLDFLDTPGRVLVLCRAALPLEGAGAGFAYSCPGRELRETWRERLTNQVAGAALEAGWLPVLGPETLEELEAVFRERGVEGF